MRTHKLTTAVPVIGLCMTVLLAGCGSAESTPTDTAASTTTTTTVPATTTTEVATASTTEPATTTTAAATTTTASPTTTTTTTSPPTTTTTEPPTTTTTEPPTTTTTEPPVVEMPPPDVVRFVITPANVAPFEEATVQWEVEGAVTVEMLLPGDETAHVDPSGSLTVAHPEGSYSYVLQATNADGNTVSRTRQLAVREPKGDWLFDEWSDELTGDQFQVLFLEASSHTYPDDEYGLYDEAPLLVIRCDEGAWVALTTWGGQYVAASYGEGVPVAYRLDDGDVIYSDESELVSNEGVWVDNAKRFVTSLLGKETMVYRVWNFDDREVGTATFPIAHLQNRIDELSNCSL